MGPLDHLWGVQPFQKRKHDLVESDHPEAGINPEESQNLHTHSHSISLSATGKGTESSKSVKFSTNKKARVTITYDVPQNNQKKNNVHTYEGEVTGLVNYNDENDDHLDAV